MNQSSLFGEDARILEPFLDGIARQDFTTIFGLVSGFTTIFGWKLRISSVKTF